MRAGDGYTATAWVLGVGSGRKSKKGEREVGWSDLFRFAVVLYFVCILYIVSLALCILRQGRLHILYTLFCP